VWVFTHDFSAHTESVWFGSIGGQFIGAPLPATIDSCATVNAVSASSGSNIWGWAITPSHVWEAVHWDGHTWTQVKVVHYSHGVWKTYAAPTSPVGPIYMSAIALIPGTRALWGVGTIQSGGLSTKGSVIIKFG
jgi:hypothetical protein